MKKVFIIAVCLLLYAVPAIAGGGKAIANFGNASQVDLAIPGKAGLQTCISEIQYDADSAGDNIVVYWRGGDRAKTYITADLAATGTVFTSATTAAVSGIGTTAIVVVQRADGEYGEYGLLASFGTTAPTFTAATTVDFKAGDIMYEMTEAFTFADIGTAATVIENEHGLFCGPVNSPILIVGETGVFYEQVFAYYREPNEEKPVGAFIGESLNLQTIALPGIAGKRIVITGWGMDAANTTDDLNIYTTTGINSGSSMITADAAAGQTDLVIVTDPGFSSSTDYAIIQRADGMSAEMIDLTSITTTAVVSAQNLQNAAKAGDVLYEAELLIEFRDMGTDAVALSNEHGLMVGPVGKPLGIMLDDTDSLLDYVIGYYEDAKGSRQTLATYSVDFLDTANYGRRLALPGVPGKNTCITGVSFDVTTASDDLAFWVATMPYDTAFLTTAVVADVTTTVHKQPGSDDDISDTAQMVIQRPDLIYAETFDYTSAVDNDSGIATDGIRHAFPVGSKMFEMETSAVYNTNIFTVGTGVTTYEKDEGFFCGPTGSPVAVTLAGTDSIIHYLTGFAE